MKTLTLALAFLFITINLSSQNTFRLGFTGAYPNYFDGPNNAKYGVDWSWAKSVTSYKVQVASKQNKSKNEQNL